MDTNELMEARKRECENLVSQFRDAQAMHDKGAISDDEFYDRYGRYNASLRVLAMLDEGTEVTDEEFAQIIAEEIEAAQEPSVLELLRADVDYALMMGGED